MSKRTRLYSEPFRNGGTCMGVIHGYPPQYCTRTGTVTREGKSYCRQHDPGDPEENRQARLAKYAREEAETNARWAASERRRLEEEACRGLTDEQLIAMITAKDTIMTYASGFQWVENTEHNALNLFSPAGLTAATVYLKKDLRGHNWFVWDENGVGGENSSEPTVEQAKITAESAVLRWGRHFK